MSVAKDVFDFKKRCGLLSEHLAKIERRGNSIANLRKMSEGNRGNHFNRVSERWLPCCRLGVPCSSRVLVSFESSDVCRVKKLVVACAETKYCLLSNVSKVGGVGLGV